MNIYVCILIMSAVTYTIRFIPVVFLRRKITNPFLVSFFHYAPFVSLSVMIFPAILYCTSDIYTALAGCLCALVLSFLNAGLIATVGASCLAVYLAQLVF